MVLLPNLCFLVWICCFIGQMDGFGVPSAVMKNHRPLFSSFGSSSPEEPAIDNNIINNNNSRERTVTKTTASSQQQQVERDVLTPFHVMDPSLVTSTESIPKSLLVSLDLLRRAVTSIPDSPMMACVLQQQNTSIIRVEQELSHTIDPLNWLREQYPITLPQNKNKHPTLFYFSNADNTLEIASLGSCLDVKESLQHFDFQTELPHGSRIYGGQRFDSQFGDVGPQQQATSEWTSFGSEDGDDTVKKGIWILPQLEMIRYNGTTTKLAVHVVQQQDTWDIKSLSELLNRVSHRVAPSLPPTTLSPVLSRDETDQDVYERSVTAAIHTFQQPHPKPLQKVVLARRMKLRFDKTATDELTALDVLRRWKYVNERGHYFYLNPGNDKEQEFFGCTPEHLFQIKKKDHPDGESTTTVLTEALAGTRPRGETKETDDELRRELVTSQKDRAENEITGNFIRQQLKEANKLKLTKHHPSLDIPTMKTTKTQSDDEDNVVDDDNRYFVRRLLQLQHICQRFECPLEDGVAASDVAKFLLKKMHPTPAVNGYPSKEAMEFIRQNEATVFDRGFYAGPFGFVSRNEAEIVVAIRSGLMSKEKSTTTANGSRTIPTKSLSIYAGGGIVPGSTVQGERSEISSKLNVISSLFPPPPLTLSSAPTPDIAWSSAFTKELLRYGVTQFYVCPGSRSTPLAAALSAAMRSSNVGVGHAHTVLDERDAAFRAIGYARATGRPAAVIASSETTTVNMYPAIMEADMHGIPMIVLMLDRPYKSRETGANQAVDQVKAYSSTYTRWFRDIPPLSDGNAPVSLALSDANHAVTMAIKQRGPVHLNVQFREHLAPVAGHIQNDHRVDSVTKLKGPRFIDVPNFRRWFRVGRLQPNNTLLEVR